MTQFSENPPTWIQKLRRASASKSSDDVEGSWGLILEGGRQRIASSLLSRFDEALKSEPNRMGIRAALNSVAGIHRKSKNESYIPFESMVPHSLDLQTLAEDWDTCVEKVLALKSTSSTHPSYKFLKSEAFVYLAQELRVFGLRLFGLAMSDILLVSSQLKSVEQQEDPKSIDDNEEDSQSIHTPREAKPKSPMRLVTYVRISAKIRDITNFQKSVVGGNTSLSEAMRDTLPCEIAFVNEEQVCQAIESDLWTVKRVQEQSIDTEKVSREVQHSLYEYADSLNVKSEDLLSLKDEDLASLSQIDDLEGQRTRLLELLAHHPGPPKSSRGKSKKKSKGRAGQKSRPTGDNQIRSLTYNATVSHGTSDNEEDAEELRDDNNPFSLLGQSASVPQIPRAADPTSEEMIRQRSARPLSQEEGWITVGNKGKGIDVSGQSSGSREGTEPSRGDDGEESRSPLDYEPVSSKPKDSGALGSKVAYPVGRSGWDTASQAETSSRRPASLRDIMAEEQAKKDGAPSGPSGSFGSSETDGQTPPQGSPTLTFEHPASPTDPAGSPQLDPPILQDVVADDVLQSLLDLPRDERYREGTQSDLGHDDEEEAGDDEQEVSETQSLPKGGRPDW